MTRIEKLVDALRGHDCDQRQVGPGVWLARCPACRDAGRLGLLEVRQASGGGVDMECNDEEVGG